MIDLSLMTYNNWPRDGENNPIFKCTEDALFYAGLIFKNSKECFNIWKLRALLLKEIDRYETSTDPDLDEFMKFAFKAQLYRECYQEIGRLRIDARDM